VNERDQMTAVDFAAQAADVRLDHGGARIEVHIPDVLEQHAAGHGLSEMLEQILEQEKLPRQELNHHVGAADGSRQQVDLEVRHCKHGIGRKPQASSSQCGDTSRQF